MNRAGKILDAAQTRATTHGAISYASMSGILSAHIRTLCRELAEYEAPLCPAYEHEVMHGEYVVFYSVDDDGDCVIETVWANGMSVLDDLNETVIEAMQETCEAHIAAELEGMEYDKGQDRYEDRMAE